MQNKESTEDALARWEAFHQVQELYKDFKDLLIVVMEELLPFKCTEIQLDIAEWVDKGPQYRMVQAQRGEAKTTITAVKAVHRLIEDPTSRVLVVSAGEDMATEISNFVIQIINGLPELECMRPDRSQGDRASVTAFDVHYTLKGPEKSPSVACIGITSSMQGKRADLLIADDVESQKNSQTAIQRDRIALLTKDFTSINQKGDIIWLGTPQSTDSIYNDLPGRGVGIRIWPGRYPTPEELPSYGAFLAPLVASRIEADPTLQTGGGPTGVRGKPVDPVLLDEDDLTKKEIDQGPEYFSLQHMLVTALSDAQRFPLKINQLRFLAFDTDEKRVPMSMSFVRSVDSIIQQPAGYPLRDAMYRVKSASDFATAKGWHMYIDPSGGGKNGDELAYAITGMLAGKVFLAAVGGIPGGLGEAQIEWLCNIIEKWRPEVISIEKNYGNGALAAVLLPVLKARNLINMIDEVWEQGQKELRIIDILEPVLGAGKLVIHEDVIADDWNSCSRYPADIRKTFSFMFQLSRITRAKGSLLHDDRLDAIAGSVRYWVQSLSQDEEKAKAAAKADQWNKMQKNPLGNGRPLPTYKDAINSALAKVGLGRVGHLGR